MNNKESEAHNVPMPVEQKKLLDMEKYKNLLKMVTDPPQQAVQAQRPSMHMPVEYEGVKLMTRIMDVNCPHCGEPVGRWSFYTRVAGSSEEIQASEVTTTPQCCPTEELTVTEEIAAKYEELYKLIKAKEQAEKETEASEASKSEDGGWKWGNTSEEEDDQPKEEPEEANEEPAEEPVEEPAEEPVEEPVEEVAEEPAEEPAPEPQPEPANNDDESGLSPEELYMKRESEAKARIEELNSKIKDMLG
tara:strand:+ start:733 stop:1473 length:741 start_codon:yes stop_codon:yes gene_type:complete